MSESANSETVNVIDKINGFRQDELAQLQRNLSEEPGAAQFTLRARNRWIDGAVSTARFIYFSKYPNISRALRTTS